MKVFTDLKTRGCQDILIAVTDGLKGMSEALAAVFPATTLQTCIVHLIRHSLDFANWKERKPLAAALRPIYTAAERRGRRRRARRVRARPVGREVSDGRRVVAARLDARDSVLRVSAGGPARDLHDQRARERPRAAAQDHQDARPFSERRGGDETDLAGAAQHHGEMGARAPFLENRDAISSRSSTRIASRPPTGVECNARMDAAVPVDAQNAPTGTWKTAQNAVSHSAHTHHRSRGEGRRTRTTSTRLTHEIPDTPRAPVLPVNKWISSMIS